MTTIYKLSKPATKEFNEGEINSFINWLYTLRSQQMVWVLSLTLRGLYHAYPPCCVFYFARRSVDVAEGRVFAELGKRQFSRDDGRLLCPRCVKSEIDWERQEENDAT